MSPHHLPAIPLLLALALVTFGYLAVVVQWPFVDCRRCNGTGKARSWFSGKTFRICRRCAGTGRRLRLARKVWNFYASRHARALSADHRSVRAANRAAARDIERNAR